MFVFSLVFKCSDVDDILHMAQLLVDLINFSVEELRKLLYFYFAIDILIFLFMFFALEMKRTVDGKPIQFAAFELIINKPFDTCQVTKLALFYVYQELHVVPNYVVLLFMLLKTILLSV